MINRNTPIPLYYQLLQLIKGSIEKGDFERQSFYDVLEKKYGIVLHHGRREFEPVMPQNS